MRFRMAIYDMSIAAPAAILLGRCTFGFTREKLRLQCRISAHREKRRAELGIIRTRFRGVRLLKARNTSKSARPEIFPDHGARCGRCSHANSPVGNMRRAYLPAYYLKQGPPRARKFSGDVAFCRNAAPLEIKRKYQKPPSKSPIRGATALHGR